MAEAFKACRTASQSLSVASNGGRGSQEGADACSPRRRAIRHRHSAVDEGRGGRVVARHIYESSLGDTLIGIESLSSVYLTHHILDPKVLARYLEAIADDMETLMSTSIMVIC